MEGLVDISAFQGGVLGLNTAAVLLLYKIHRDVKAVTETQRRHWHWIEKLRRYAWPEAFSAEDGHEPSTDP